MPIRISRRQRVSLAWPAWLPSATQTSFGKFAIRLSPSAARTIQSVGRRPFASRDWVETGSMFVMVGEGLQQTGSESFVAGVSPRSEEFRIIYNAPHGAGVVQA